jgi:hypothetical protein
MNRAPDQPESANEYLLSAIEHIARRLGESYAKAHPELIGAFMQTSVVNLGAAEIARAIESAAISISTIRPDQRVAEELRKRTEVSGARGSPRHHDKSD